MTTTTPLDEARAAQQRFRDHFKVCRVPEGVRCWTCDDLDAKAEGAWVRAAVAEQRAVREAVGAATGAS